MSSSTCTLPGVADAAQVVAAQVDQHDVLGALLLVGAQVVDEAPVLGVVGAAPRVCRRWAASPRWLPLHA